MKKIIVIFITCLLLFVSVVSIDAGLPNKLGNKKTKVIYVDSDFYYPKKQSDGSRALPYTTIQQGVDAASPGYTVFVFNGIYYENVVVNKTISLVGEDKYSTIIQGSGFVGYDLYITMDWVNISGFTFKGKYSEGSWYGVGLYYSNHCTISGNIALDHYSFGIELDHSDYNNITSNNVSDNTETGIILRYSSYNTISDNKVTGNNDWGICLSWGSNYNTITNNNLNANQWSNVRMFDSNNNLVLDNNASNCYAGSGISLSNSSYNTFTGNVIVNSDSVGIRLDSSYNNIIFNNILNNTKYP
jgi:parallel beta-helix repeat protein